MPWTQPQGGGLLWGGDWEYEWLRASLQLMTDTFAELSGFDLVSLNVVEGDELVSTVNTEMRAPGTIRGEPLTADQLTGMRFPMAEIYELLAKADDWGHFRFVPKDRLGVYDGTAWVSERSYGDEPEAWHAMHTLIAPLHNSAGQMVGLLSVDQPTDGKIPDAARRALLNRLAAQMENAVLNALAGAQLQERASLASAVHDLVQDAASETTVEGIIAAVAEPLAEVFALEGAWIRLFDAEMPTGIRSAGGAVGLPEDPLLTVATHVVAPRLLERGLATVIGLHQEVNADTEVVSVEHVRAFLRSHGLGSMLFVPLGAGPRCIGSLTMVRGPEGNPWREAEYLAAIGLGLDLGAVIAATHSLAQEQEVVRDLTQLDAYKDDLVSKVSDELRAPLQSIVSDLEQFGRPDGRGTVAVASMQAKAQQLNVIVDHLLQLARVADPNHPLDRRPVDLGALVEQTCDRVSAVATLGQEIELTLPVEPVVVSGSGVELRLMVDNVVRNAVQFMPYPGTIAVSLIRAGDDAVLTVADEGIGIPAADLGRVFEEFYRSSDPAARDLNGTGLGLTIVSRVVFRHGGHLEVTSATRRGSTFRIFLPIAD